VYKIFIIDMTTVALPLLRYALGGRVYTRLMARIARLERGYKRHMDIVAGAVELLVFLVFMSGLIYVNQVHVNDRINSFLDALYFTVTTLTTTGFGDITVVGDGGKLLIIITMVVGIGLFLRLVNRVFTPNKNYVACTSCHYARHDIDASHCKRCGEAVDQAGCRE
jgi:voltage-gated potassium channel